MLKLVLDTDVIVAGMRSPSGASAAILAAIDAGGAILLLTPSMALEYEAVCLRVTHINAIGGHRREAVNFVNAVIALAEPVMPDFSWRPQLHDPNDEMVLEAAINGLAHAIVTFNSKDFGTAPHRFGIELLSPAEAIRRIRQ